MKKRWFALALALILVLSVMPGAASAAEVIDASVPPETYARLSALPIAETYDVSAATRKAVTAAIVAGLQNWKAEIDVSAYGLTKEEGYSLYYEVLDAHYELFYVKQGYGISWSGDVVTTIRPVYDTAFTKSDTAAFNSVSDSIVAGIPKGTDAEKLLYLHDYLITHCDYDQTYSKTSAYNALVEGSAVCEGYAKALKHLCDLSGLTCEYVSSEAIDHAWNMVKLGDMYYYIDCTWDDPLYGSGHMPECNCSHKNFLMSKEACIEAGHVSSDWVNGKGESVYSYATSQKYDAYWWKDLHRPVQWIGDLLCYARSTDLSHVFFRSSGAASETPVELQGGGEVWHVWGSGSYYTDNSGNPLSFTTVAAQGGAFYYSTPTQIWKLTTGGEITLAYTLSSDEQSKGYLCGVQGSEEGLIYYLGQDPYQPSVATGKLDIPGETTAKPVITTQPADQSVAVGQTVTFKVAASGTGLSYQWQSSTDNGGAWANVSGATAASYSFITKDSDNGTLFRCVVKNTGGSVTSNSAKLTVTAPPTLAKPTIKTQPAAQTADAGQTVTFKVEASGTGLSYQWQSSTDNGGAWTNISGATAASYTLTTKESDNGTLFRCVVKNEGGSVTSNSAKLTVNAAAAAAPAISSVKADVTGAKTGETITWTAKASGGTGTLKYYFILYKDGTKVKTQAYSTKNTFSYAPKGAGTFKVKVYVKDAADAKVNKTSAGVTVTSAAPTISSVKAGISSAYAGETITWTATASGGTGTLKYYFILYKDGVKLKTRSYSTTNTFSYTPTEAGSYKVKVYVKDSSGAKANKTSGKIAVTLGPPAILSVKAGKTSSAVGEKLTWTAKAVGSEKPLKYCFVLYKNGKKIKTQAYSTKSTFSYTPKGAGTYKVKVYVKDASGEKVYKTSAKITVS